MTDTIRASIRESIEGAHDVIDLDQGFSYRSICDELPHSHLLKSNAIFSMLKKQNQITLAHQTVGIDQIEKTGCILKSFGCLGKAIYAIPVYEDGRSKQTYNDNFYELVLSHQDAEMMGKIDTIIIKSRNTTRENGVLFGMNYLRMGKLIALLSRGWTLHEYENGTIESKVSTLVSSIEINTLRNPESSTEEVFDSLSKLGRQSSFFALLYYEAVTQVIMLSSEDEKTIHLSKKGELNAQSFYSVLSTYKTLDSRRFDATDFTPTHGQLLELIDTMNREGVILVDTKLTVKRCAAHVVSIINSLGTASDFQQHLYGQEFLAGVGESTLSATLAILAQTLNEYYTKHDVLYVINTATFKPEFGIVRDEGQTEYLTKGQDGTMRKLDIRLRSEL